MPGADVPPRPRRRLVAAAAIIADGAVLAARRTAPPAVAGRWELPGGKVEPGESPEKAALREVQEELGVAVRIGRRLGRRFPIRPGMSLVVYLAELLEPAPTVSEVHDRLRWLRVEELDDVDWLPADRPVLDLLRAALTGPVEPTPAEPGTAEPGTAAPVAAAPVAGAAARRARGRRGRRSRGSAQAHPTPRPTGGAAVDGTGASGGADGPEGPLD